MPCVPFCSQLINCAQVSLLVPNGVFVSMDIGVSVMFGCWRMDGAGTPVMSASKTGIRV